MKEICPICKGKSLAHDVVDFNKSCIEKDNKYLVKSLIPIYYFLCEKCNFCYAPTFKKWSKKDFEKYIYNKDYIKVDPDYENNRPFYNSKLLINTFKNNYKNIKHLDYGGGNKTLSKFLQEKNWSTKSYDKFVDINTNIQKLGKFNLITLFEVFEHVVDIDELMNDLSLLIEDDGLIIFSTLLSDKNIKKNSRLQWWYAAPRNGHISLFSKKSLYVLASKYNFKIAHNNSNIHFLYKDINSTIVKTVLR